MVIAPGTALRHHGVEMAQEADRLQVFAAAIDVGNPLALLAAVIAIQHRGDRIDPQPVDVEMLQPVHAAGDQEALHFPAAEIVDVGVPVLMESLPRIGMLEQRRAVETGQAMRIARENAPAPSR